MRRCFFGPGDWLTLQSSARSRRALAAWVLIFSIVPGLPVWFVLRSSVAFVGFLSILAITFSAWGILSAETPVESEEET